MSRKAIISILFAVLLGICLSTVLCGEIVDRIVAVVNGRIITSSDIQKEHRIQLALGDPEQTDPEALDSLIDRYLMEEEMSQYPGLDVAEADVEQRMKLVTDTHGLSQADLRTAILQKFQRRQYLYVRFGQFIVVSNEEIETFYNNEFVPEAKRRGETPPELSQVATQIRQYITDLKQGQELEGSLKELRNRSTTAIEIIQ